MVIPLTPATAAFEPRAQSLSSSCEIPSGAGFAPFGWSSFSDRPTSADWRWNERGGAACGRHRQRSGNTPPVGKSIRSLRARRNPSKVTSDRSTSGGSSRDGTISADWVQNAGRWCGDAKGQRMPITIEKISAVLVRESPEAVVRELT